MTIWYNKIYALIGSELGSVHQCHNRSIATAVSVEDLYCTTFDSATSHWLPLLQVLHFANQLH
jgi:hypothetical protein